MIIAGTSTTATVLHPDILVDPIACNLALNYWTSYCPWPSSQCLAPILECRSVADGKICSPTRVVHASIFPTPTSLSSTFPVALLSTLIPALLISNSWQPSLPVVASVVRHRLHPLWRVLSVDDHHHYWPSPRVPHPQRPIHLSVQGILASESCDVLLNTMPASPARHFVIKSLLDLDLSSLSPQLREAQLGRSFISTNVRIPIGCMIMKAILLCTRSSEQTPIPITDFGILDLLDWSGVISFGIGLFYLDLSH